VEQEAVHEVVEEIVHHQDREYVQPDLPPRLWLGREAERKDEREDHQPVEQAPVAVPLLVRGVVGPCHLLLEGLAVELCGRPEGGNQHQQSLADDGRRSDADRGDQRQLPFVVFEQPGEEFGVHVCCLSILKSFRVVLGRGSADIDRTQKTETIVPNQ
jgi:hypothetical protein